MKIFFYILILNSLYSLYNLQEKVELSNFNIIHELNIFETDQKSDQILITKDERDKFDIYFEVHEFVDDSTNTNIYISYPQLFNLEPESLKIQVNTLLKENSEFYFYEGYNTDIETQIELLNSKILSVTYSGFYFTSVGKGYKYKKATNIDLEAGEIIELSNIFSENLKNKLNRETFFYNGKHLPENIRILHEDNYRGVNSELIEPLFEKYYENSYDSDFYFSEDNFNIILDTPETRGYYFDIATNYSNLEDSMINKDFWIGIFKTEPNNMMKNNQIDDIDNLLENIFENTSKIYDIQNINFTKKDIIEDIELIIPQIYFDDQVNEELNKIIYDFIVLDELKEKNTNNYILSTELKGSITYANNKYLSALVDGYISNNTPQPYTRGIVVDIENLNIIDIEDLITKSYLKELVLKSNNGESLILNGVTLNKIDFDNENLLHSEKFMQMFVEYLNGVESQIYINDYFLKENSLCIIVRPSPNLKENYILEIKLK